MPTIPESNDPVYKTMYVPASAPMAHHRYCECSACLADPERWPNLHRPEPDYDINPLENSDD